MEETKMENLSETKMEQLNKMPVVETSVAKSSDGKWVIHRTTITDIKPVSYMEKVMNSKNGKKKK